jgi:thermitase
VEVIAFGNELDNVFRKRALEFWITTEYQPSSNQGPNADEVNLGLDRTYRIIFRCDSDIPDEVINEVKKVPIVQEVRKINVVGSEIPQPGIAMGMSIADRSRDEIYLKQAQIFSKGHKQVTVAVLDTGVDLAHEELKGVISKKADFVNMEGLDTSGFIGDTLGYDNIPDDEVGHGTHVAGIIAGRGIKMPLGVAPECRIMAVRVLATLQQGDKRVGAGLIDNINVGIKWAVDNGADVINMSLGVKQEYGGLPHEEVIKYALNKGVTVVAASGNDGTGDKYYPGALPGVLSVGATSETGSVADFSNYGAVTLLAPGSNIYSSFIESSYAFCSGTSQAAPFVSGAIALLKSYAMSAGRKLRDSQVKYLLKHTCDKPDQRFKGLKSGYGKLNILDALRLLKYQSNYSR